MSNDYRIVPRAPYNGKREDNFRATTLHLSFTDWRLPLQTSVRRVIDEAVSLAESVVSVYNRGKWVADLDILGVKWEPVVKIVPGCRCSDEERARSASLPWTSVDSWDDSLDLPESTAIFRGNGN